MSMMQYNNILVFILSTQIWIVSTLYLETFESIGKTSKAFLIFTNLYDLPILLFSFKSSFLDI